jgi:hypothetical protein
VGSTSGFGGIIQSGEYTNRDKQFGGVGFFHSLLGDDSGEWGVGIGVASLWEIIRGSGEGIIYATYLYKQNASLLIGVVCHELESEPTREGLFVNLMAWIPARANQRG